MPRYAGTLPTPSTLSMTLSGAWASDPLWNVWANLLMSSSLPSAQTRPRLTVSPPSQNATAKLSR